jgi:transposase
VRSFRPHGSARGDGRKAVPYRERATNSACFETYIEPCLILTLKPGDIVVMDNRSCYESAEVERRIGQASADLGYLPAYRPDMNPIEEMFRKVKEHPRPSAARAVETLMTAMRNALRSVTTENNLGWFEHSLCRCVQPGNRSMAQRRVVRPASL